MGFISSLGNVFKSIGSGILDIGKTALQAVAPKVTDMLKGIVGDGFDALKSGAQNLAGNLPGPLGDIAKSLIGKGFDYLKNLTGDALANEIKKIVGQVAPQSVAGAPAGTTVATPALGTAAGAAARASSTAAATAAVNQVAAQVTGQAAPSGQSMEDAMGAAAGALQEPAAPPAGATEGQMIQYQEQLQKYARMMDMYSKIIQAKNDMQKGIIANFRV